MSGEFHSAEGNHYERPGLPWVCGHASEGEPCPLGPSRLGVCGAASECAPQLIDDRWQCNRPAHRGGPCDHGPGPRGECANASTKCAPVRSVHARRGWFTFCCTALTIGVLAIVFHSRSRDAILAPGSLASGHQQLLAGSQQQGRCKNCHAAAEDGVLKWLVATCSGGQCVGTPQSTLCLKCHESTIQPEAALLAHSVSPQLLAAVRTFRGVEETAATQQGQRELACATCHQEHHGAAHDLTAMTDAQCQTCHAQQFRDLAHGHPEFRNWPRRREPVIHFDHAAHRFQHFPKQQAKFQCASCHGSDEAGEIDGRVDYQQACASCHDQPLSDRTADGLVFLQLPMIDELAFEDAELDVGEWPEFCTGDFDGSIPPFMRLLLLADENARQGWEQVGPDFAFGDIDPDNPQEIRRAAEMVWSIKRLLYDLGARGQAAIRERLTKVLGRDVSAAEAGKLSAQLPADLLYELNATWLPNLPKEIQLRDAGQWPPLVQRVKESQEPAEVLPASSRQGEYIEGTPAWPVNPLRPVRQSATGLSEGTRAVTIRQPTIGPLTSGTAGEDGDAFPSGEPQLPRRAAMVPESAEAAGPEQEARRASGEDLAVIPGPARQRASEVSPADRVAGGGWFRDDEVFALCYRSSGHGDGFLRAWHEAQTENMRGKQSLLQQVRLHELGGCSTCHHVERAADTVASIWSTTGGLQVGGLTRFSHQPHLTQPSLRNCETCHVLDERHVQHGTSWDPDRSVMASDFQAIHKHACVGCHAGTELRSGCTTCHNYHARESALWGNLRSSAAAAANH